MSAPSSSPAPHKRSSPPYLHSLSPDSRAPFLSVRSVLGSWIYLDTIVSSDWIHLCYGCSSSSAPPVSISVPRYVRSCFIPPVFLLPFSSLTWCNGVASMVRHIAGAIAGITEILTLYPLDVVKTRQQLSTTKPLSMIPMFKEIIRSEG
jgi:hypothetical protein